jgi:cold shock protein
MEYDDKAPQVLQGLVKWFDPVKGFGFVVAEDSGSDILLHANVLRNFGQSSVADGSSISVRVQQTQRGFQAVEVIAITPPEGAGFQMTEESGATLRADLAELPLQPARVKWFDKGKGFGFANVFGEAEDIFIHIEVLRQSGLADLGAGEAVSLRIVDGKRGRMAAQIASWEAALRRAE